MAWTRSFGGFRVASEELVAPLGTFEGRELRGVARRQSIHAGGGAGIAVGWTRPVAVEVIEDGRLARLPIAAARSGARLAWFALGTLLLLIAFRRARRDLASERGE